MNLYRWKKFMQKAIAGILCTVFIVIGFTYPVIADEKAVIIQSILKGDNICLFIKGLGEYSNVTGQIGRESIEIVNSGSDISGHTIIMIDNSLSVTKDNLVKVKEVLKQYLERKGDEEKISLAIYGTEIQYLVEKETDSGEIIDDLELIISEDKDTYLTDVLYDELQKLENKTEYTKIIVITDGVDNKEIGYTREELSAYLSNNDYPIYALGCKYKNNEEQLKNLFALSRLTNAGYYLLDDYTEYSEIVDGLCETVTCVEIKIPDEFRDGSEKNILLTFECEEGTVEISDKLSMPFGLKKEEELIEEPTVEPAETSVVEETPVIEDGPVVTPEPEKENPAEEESIDLVTISAVAVIIIALGILLITYLRKKTGKKGKTQQKEIITSQLEENDNATVIVEPMSDEGATVFLGNRESTRYLVVLQDTYDAGKVFRYPLANRVIIGRKYAEDVNIVLNYDPTISAKHCEISMKGDRFYVKDLHSSNGTFINGIRVSGEMEVASGDNIRLGNLDMTIIIEQC